MCAGLALQNLAPERYVSPFASLKIRRCGNFEENELAIVSELVPNGVVSKNVGMISSSDSAARRSAEWSHNQGSSLVP